MVFARIGHGSCYYHWNEIFAGVRQNWFRIAILTHDLSTKSLPPRISHWVISNIKTAGLGAMVCFIQITE